MRRRAVESDDFWARGVVSQMTWFAGRDHDTVRVTLRMENGTGDTSISMPIEYARIAGIGVGSALGFTVQILDGRAEEEIIARVIEAELGGEW